MKPKNILLLILVFAGGVTVGKFFLTTSNVSQPAGPLQYDGQNAGNISGNSTNNKIAQVSAGSAIGAAALEDFGRSLTSPKAAERRAGLYRMLVGLNRENWGAVYDVFKSRRLGGNHDRTEWEMFLNAAGAVDGAGIMKRLIDDQQPDMERSPAEDYHFILRTWVPADESQADAWFKSLPKGRFRNGLYSGYLGGLAEVDLSRAIDGVQNVDAQNRHYFLNDLAQRVFQQGKGDAWLEQAAAFAEKSGEKELGYARMVYEQVADRVIKTNAEAGNHERNIEWLSQHQAKEFVTAGPWESAAQRYVGAQPDIAMKRFDKMYETNPTQAVSAMGVGVVTWGKKDAVKAEQWLAAQQDKPFYDKVAEPYIRTLMETTPESATKWIDSLANPDLRESMRSIKQR